MINRIAFMVIFIVTEVFSQNLFEYEKIKIGDQIFKILETPHPYPSCSGEEPEVVWQDYFFYPNASYLAFRFNKVDLAEGDFIEILDENGNLWEQISESNENFLTKMIFSEGVFIILYSKNKNNSHFGYLIDRVTYGYPNAMDNIYSSNENFATGICGQNDLKNAICYANNYSDVYNKAKAVAKVIYDASQVSGTAFLCSCDNYILTNYHVIPDQITLNNTHFIFDYEDEQCSFDGGGSTNWQCIGGIYKKGGYINGQYIYDYSLIKLSNCDPQNNFGYIKLSKDSYSSGHKFFIAGHPGGRGKEITYESDRTYSGNCEIKDVSNYQCSPFNLYNAAYSFLCDIEGGSSGSPMISLSNYRAIGIVHCAGCPDENAGNKGVMLSKFISQIQNDLPNCSFNYIVSGKINGNSSNDINGVKILIDGQQKGISDNQGIYNAIVETSGTHIVEPSKGDEGDKYCFNPKIPQFLFLIMI